MALGSGFGKPRGGKRGITITLYSLSPQRHVADIVLRTRTPILRRSLVPLRGFVVRRF
jgi:hypothetical protein